MNARLCLYAAAVLSTLLMCASCSQPSRAPAPSQFAISDEHYHGPPITVNVLRQQYLDPIQYIAVIEITAPTGGWHAVLDHAEVDQDEQDNPGIAKVYITLTAPGENEMVTQALQPHHITFRTTDSFEEAEVFIRLHRRGQPPRNYIGANLTSPHVPMHHPSIGDS